MSAVFHNKAYFQREELPPLNVVLLRDHDLAGKAAQRLVERVLLPLLHQSEVHQDYWSFEELAHPQFRQEALELAKSCDLIVLATLGEILPVSISLWIEDWTQTRIQKDAAFVYLTAYRDMPAAVHEQFSDLRGMDNLAVFTSTLGLPGSELQGVVPGRSRTQSLSAFLPRPERWGINE